VALAGIFGVALLLVGAQTALANSFIDFQVLAGAGGTISWAGDSNPLAGISIDVADVKGEGGTPKNDKAKLAISGGLLNFTTGSYLTSDTDSWKFTAGGTFVVTGGISAIGIADGSVLLAGTFTSAKVTQTSDGVLVALGGIADEKNPLLLTYYGYGLVPGLATGALNLSFLVDGDVSPGDAFTSSAIGSGDIINKPKAVPEPAAATLLVSSLLPALVFAAWRRRRS
jgi:hypothetical protein